jgi:sialidase-1
MRYWQQEVLPVSLIAYWKLDEAEGIVAADKAGTNNGTLVGDPIWQPAGGKLGGALQLDGIDDYVRIPFVVDPGKGPFSVFAWVKGGAPGQAILSQAGGANWLMAGDPGGVLATELRESGRKAKPLASQAVITDVAWHRVGFVWDGTNRILYVDDVEVTRDRQASLAASAGNISIGAGTTLAPGTFWSGLIDDVRIYDRAVTP